jgi:bacterioferritin-associated ferredoxin
MGEPYIIRLELHVSDTHIHGNVSKGVPAEPYTRERRPIAARRGECVEELLELLVWALKPRRQEQGLFDPPDAS